MAISPPPSPPTLVSPSKNKRLELGTKVFKAPTPPERRSNRTPRWVWKSDDVAAAAATADVKTLNPSQSLGAQSTNHAANKPVIKHHLLLEPTIERQKRKQRLKERHQMEMEHKQNSSDDLPLSMVPAKKRMALARISKMENMERGNTDLSDDEGMSSFIERKTSSRFMEPTPPLPSTCSSSAAQSNSAADPCCTPPTLSSDHGRGVIRPDVIESKAFLTATPQVPPLPSIASRNPLQSGWPASFRPTSPSSSSSSSSSRKLSSSSAASYRYRRGGAVGKKKINKFSIRTCLSDPATMKKTREILGLFAESGIGDERDSSIAPDLTEDQPSDYSRHTGIDTHGYIKTKKMRREKKETKRRGKRDRQVLDFDRLARVPWLVEGGMPPLSSNHSHRHYQDRIDAIFPSTKTNPQYVDRTSTRPREVYDVDLTTRASSTKDRSTSDPPQNLLSRNKPAIEGASSSTTSPLPVMALASRNWTWKDEKDRKASVKPSSCKSRARTDDANHTGVAEKLSYRLQQRKVAQTPRDNSRHATIDDDRHHRISDGYHSGRTASFDCSLLPTSDTSTGSPMSFYAADMKFARRFHDRIYAARTLDAVVTSENSCLPWVEGSSLRDSSLFSALVGTSISPSIPISFETRLPYSGPGEVSMLVADMSWQRAAYASADLLPDLNLLERQGFALELLVASTDLPTFAASLQHVKSLHRNTPLRPGIAKIVSDAEVRCRALMEESFLRHLTVPCAYGGLGYTFGHANSILFLLRPVLGSNLGLDAIDMARLLDLGLSSAEALDLLPYIREMKDEILTTTYAISRRLLNVAERMC